MNEGLWKAGGSIDIWGLMMLSMEVNVDSGEEDGVWDLDEGAEIGRRICDAIGVKKVQSFIK